MAESEHAGAAGWPSLLLTSRAALAVLVFAAVGLLLPPQTRDMLAYLADGNAWRFRCLAHGEAFATFLAERYA